MQILAATGAVKSSLDIDGYAGGVGLEGLPVEIPVSKLVGADTSGRFSGGIYGTSFFRSSGVVSGGFVGRPDEQGRVVVSVYTQSGVRSGLSISVWFGTVERPYSPTEAVTRFVEIVGVDSTDRDYLWGEAHRYNWSRGSVSSSVWGGTGANVTRYYDFLVDRSRYLAGLRIRDLSSFILQVHTHGSLERELGKVEASLGAVTSNVNIQALDPFDAVQFTIKRGTSDPVPVPSGILKDGAAGTTVYLTRSTSSYRPRFLAFAFSNPVADSVLNAVPILGLFTLQRVSTGAVILDNRPYLGLHQSDWPNQIRFEVSSTEWSNAPFVSEDRYQLTIRRPGSDAPTMTASASLGAVSSSLDISKVSTAGLELLPIIIPMTAEFAGLPQGGHVSVDVPPAGMFRDGQTPQKMHIDVFGGTSRELLVDTRGVWKEGILRIAWMILLSSTGTLIFRTSGIGGDRPSRYNFIDGVPQEALDTIVASETFTVILRASAGAPSIEIDASTGAVTSMAEFPPPTMSAVALTGEVASSAHMMHPTFEVRADMGEVESSVRMPPSIRIEASTGAVESSMELDIPPLTLDAFDIEEGYFDVIRAIMSVTTSDDGDITALNAAPLAGEIDIAVGATLSRIRRQNDGMSIRLSIPNSSPRMDALFGSSGMYPSAETLYLATTSSPASLTRFSLTAAGDRHSTWTIFVADAASRLELIQQLANGYQFIIFIPAKLEDIQMAPIVANMGAVESSVTLRQVLRPSADLGAVESSARMSPPLMSIEATLGAVESSLEVRPPSFRINPSLGPVESAAHLRAGTLRFTADLGPIESSMTFPLAVPEFGAPGFLSHRIEWSRGFEEDYEFRTSIVEHSSGAEQRIADRSTPRISYRFTSFINTGEIAGALAEASYRQGEVIRFPHPRDRGEIVNNASGRAIQVEFSDLPTWMSIGSQVYVNVGSDSYPSVVLNIQGNTAVIGFADNRDIPAGATVSRAVNIWPTTSPSMGTETSRAGAIDIRGLGDPETEWHESFAQGLNKTLNGKEFLALAPNWAAPPVITMAENWEDVDTGRGAFGRNFPIDFPTRVMRCQYLMHTEERLNQVLGLFYRSRGRQKTWYMPSHVHDLPPTEGLRRGASSFHVEGRTIGQAFLSSQVFKRIQVLYDGGSFIRTVESVNEAEDNRSRVQLTASIPVDVPLSALKKISWVTRMRFETDLMSLNWHTSGVAETRFTARTVRDR